MAVPTSFFAPQWPGQGKPASLLCEWLVIRCVLCTQFACDTGEVLYFCVNYTVFFGCETNKMVSTASICMIIVKVIISILQFVVS